MARQYWKCRGCGAIHERDQENESALLELASIGPVISDGATCTECGTNHATADILAAKYDPSEPDDLLAQMIADPRNAKRDKNTNTWSYRTKKWWEVWK